LWEDVLGVKRIGIRDNFWELGGHSLLAARLMHKLEQAFRRKLPLATLLQAPTVADLGEVLRLDRWRPEWFSLVPIQAQGSRHPFFCVHGIGGNVVGFRALAQYIGKEQPFYALQAQGLDGVQACHTRVPDMAAHYIRELRTVQPRGPYFLGGFSFGGWVALEMAQQLCAQGEQVGIVALLDSYPRHLQSFSASVKSMLAPGNRQQLITVLPNSIFKVIRRKIIWISLPRVLRNVQNACTAAEQDHRVSPYNGRVALFRASTKLFRGCDDQAEGWRKLACGGFELYEIPGQHGDIILEPGVKVLAKKLRECLVNAQAHCGASAVAL
jgi:thioesterase domain-containing protein/acyl carrier protein